jgi:sugar lactone lactonase YvrE
MTVMTPPIFIVCFITLACICCKTTSKTDQSDTSRKTNEQYPYLTFKQGTFFPGDSSLLHPEDGVALTDGRIIVSDQANGLRLIERNGATRPFGNFTAAGFVNNIADISASPNGVFLEHDKQHLLMCDVRGGKIYRVNISSENVAMIYDHPYGINAVYRDKTGALWFTQSGRSTEKEGLGVEINSPVANAAIFRMTKSDSLPVIVKDSLYLANGITMDAEEKTLYVAEMMMNRILSFEVDVKTGAAKYSGAVATVLTPDNILVDDKGTLIVASPGSNKVIAVDLKNHSQHVLFDASTEESRMIADEWYRRSQLGLPRAELITYEMHSPLPGLLTGMFFSQDRRTLYITNLGNDLVKVDLK